MSTSRWLTWTPSGSIIEKTPEHEPSKTAEINFDVFDGSTPGQMQKIEADHGVRKFELTSGAEPTELTKPTDERNEIRSMPEVEIPVACRCSKWPFPHIHNQQGQERARRAWNRDSKWRIQ